MSEDDESTIYIVNEQKPRFIMILDLLKHKLMIADTLYSFYLKVYDEKKNWDIVNNIE